MDNHIAEIDETEAQFNFECLTTAVTYCKWPPHPILLCFFKKTEHVRQGVKFELPNEREISMWRRRCLFSGPWLIPFQTISDYWFAATFQATDFHVMARSSNRWKSVLSKFICKYLYLTARQVWVSVVSILRHAVWTINWTPYGVVYHYVYENNPMEDSFWACDHLRWFVGWEICFLLQRLVTGTVSMFNRDHIALIRC